MVASTFQTTGLMGDVGPFPAREPTSAELRIIAEQGLPGASISGTETHTGDPIEPPTERLAAAR